MARFQMAVIKIGRVNDQNEYSYAAAVTAVELEEGDECLSFPEEYEGMPVTHIGYTQGYRDARIEYGDWHHPTHRPDEYIPARYEADASPIRLPASVKRVALHRNVMHFSRIDLAEKERRLVYEVNPENQAFGLRPDGSLVLKCFL